MRQNRQVFNAHLQFDEEIRGIAARGGKMLEWIRSGDSEDCLKTGQNQRLKISLKYPFPVMTSIEKETSLTMRLLESMAGNGARS